uniref:C2H2-type domain-containing protein n=1 Tax=Latimeria chalumnae TaxID=7897 RepID=H3A7P7_LATCH
LTSSLSLDRELDVRIGKASVTFGRLTSRVWNNKLLTLNTKVSVYQTTLDVRRLCWLGHVERMPQDHLPKAVLYGELKNRPRCRGRPKLRYSDKVKQGLKKFSIPIDNWENPAHNRSVWRSRVKAGAVTMESHQRAQAEACRRARKQSVLQSPSGEWTCSHCGKVCRSCIGLFSHTTAKHH